MLRYLIVVVVIFRNYFNDLVYFINLDNNNNNFQDIINDNNFFDNISDNIFILKEMQGE